MLTEGFAVGMKISVSGAGTSNNNESGAIIVQITEDTMLLSPVADLTNEAAGSSVTISGDLVADSSFALGAFSATTGYPAAVTFYEQRLVFASTTEQTRRTSSAICIAAGVCWSAPRAASLLSPAQKTRR